jgi:deazaflavin-dependent oxidoreductase (nitroreductase family)
MSAQSMKPPKLPPTWFKHLFWRVHRFLYRFASGRVLWTPRNKRGWGAMYLTTIGRKSGRRRSVIVGYIEDCGTPVVLAMNGWDEGQPAWWLNLEAHPDAVIRVKGQPERRVRARRVNGAERSRLWRRWAGPKIIDLTERRRLRGSGQLLKARSRPRRVARSRLLHRTEPRARHLESQRMSHWESRPRARGPGAA